MGAPTLEGVPTYDFAKFSQTLHEIERVWTTWGWATRPKFYYVDPPLHVQPYNETYIHKNNVSFNSTNSTRIQNGKPRLFALCVQSCKLRSNQMVNFYLQRHQVSVISNSDWSLNSDSKFYNGCQGEFFKMCFKQRR